MSVLENAKKGIIMHEFEYIANIEEVDVEYIRMMVSKGEIVIFKNIKRDIKPVAVGKGLSTKIMRISDLLRTCLILRLRLKSCMLLLRLEQMLLWT